MGVQRVGSVIGLADGAGAEYERLHRAVPSPVLNAIRRAGIANYTIFRHDNLLFAYYEHHGTDLAADLAEMGRDEATRTWWDRVGPLQRTLRSRDGEPWWVEMTEVFHAD